MTKRVGALWKRESEKGKTYLSGVLDMGAFGEVRVSIFKNDRKEKENQPDYNVVLSNDVGAEVEAAQQGAGQDNGF